MLGISYGELFLIIGATAALIGPKDLPLIARTAGRLAGRAVGYVQMARGQFDSVMQQTQAHQVHKELQDTMAQLEAIRHEIRTMSFINPGPLTRRLVDNMEPPNSNNEIGPQKPGTEGGTANSDSEIGPQKPGSEGDTAGPKSKDYSSANLASADIHSQATSYAKMAESTSLNTGTMNNELLKELTDESGLTVFPVSAESSRLLPDRKDHVMGSDIILEAVLEAEVARNAKDFFSRPENLKQHE